MEKLISLFVLSVFGLAIGAVFFGFPVMLLWNWLMPELFGIVKITFWQSLGLVSLASILFKTTASNNKN